MKPCGSYTTPQCRCLRTPCPGAQCCARPSLKVVQSLMLHLLRVRKSWQADCNALQLWTVALLPQSPQRRSKMQTRVLCCVPLPPPSLCSSPHCHKYSTRLPRMLLSRALQHCSCQVDQLRFQALGNSWLRSGVALPPQPHLPAVACCLYEHHSAGPHLGTLNYL